MMNFNHSQSSSSHYFPHSSFPVTNGDSKKRRDAISIWQAGVRAVDPVRLVTEALELVELNDAFELHFGSSHEPRTEILSKNAHLFVIGMGKASAGMALGAEKSLQPLVAHGNVSGWVNIPDDPDLLATPVSAIHLYPARPKSMNEPTEAGVFGSRKIVEILDQATPDDLILCLISGGGSALLPLPVAEISLQEKLDVTRFLSAAGANIAELNTVRKELSQLKGGGIRQLCRGKRLVSLILSDVLGDPLDVIASGATVENRSNAADAWEILQKFHAMQEPALLNICRTIQSKAGLLASSHPETDASAAKSVKISSVDSQNRTQKDDSLDDNAQDFLHHANIIIGNNRTAVEAAAQKARELGYHPRTHAALACEQDAEDIGLALLKQAIDCFQKNATSASSPIFSWDEADDSSCDCLISGGEPVVHLAPSAKRGRGGRNQQLVLAALIEWISACPKAEGEFVKTRNESVEARDFGAKSIGDSVNAIMDVPVFLSGGTDGEDGPTDAAGAFFDSTIVQQVLALQKAKLIDPLDSLHRNDAWNFFRQCDALLTIGATGTNVCDLRIVLK